MGGMEVLIERAGGMTVARGWTLVVGSKSRVDRLNQYTFTNRCHVLSLGSRSLLSTLCVVFRSKWSVLPLLRGICRR